MQILFKVLINVYLLVNELCELVSSWNDRNIIDKVKDFSVYMYVNVCSCVCVWDSKSCTLLNATEIRLATVK